MTKATFSATLARDAQVCISADPSRYYLQGFCVEPCLAGGVLLISTDGHRLTVLRDPAGTIEGEPVIVQLPKHVLDLCKPGRRGAPDPTITIDGTIAHVTQSGNTVASAHGVIVDGRFPDWRRVVPQPGEIANLARVTFDPALLGSFAKLGRYITLAPGDKDALSPWLVRVTDRDDVLGVLMPVRDGKEDILPAWF